MHAPDLDRAQLAVARAVAGTDPLVVVVGPAGAGKTTAIRAAVAQLHAEGRAVFGLAPSATAAGVLAAETGVTADTIDKLLFEQRRPGGPIHGFGLPAGATVIVDEASMVPTAKLAQLAELADRHRWRVVLVGDACQLSAVERGGMFAHLIDIGPTVALERIHRFTADWEREASLRLRRGDPEVLTVYEGHGRLHDGVAAEMDTAMLGCWSTVRAVGEDVAIIATRTETVARLDRLAQAERLAAGELDPIGWVAGREGCHLHVGERIATRANTRRLRTDRGVMVKNRARWRIEAIHPDGAVTAVGRDGQVRLPGDYVVSHVELGYAETVHASQAARSTARCCCSTAPLTVGPCMSPLPEDGTATKPSWSPTTPNRPRHPGRGHRPRLGRPSLRRRPSRAHWPARAAAQQSSGARPARPRHKSDPRVARPGPAPPTSGRTVPAPKPRPGPAPS